MVSQFGFSVKLQGANKKIRPVNLLSIEGLHKIITSLVTNFTSFFPFGAVLGSLLGIAVA
jgi:aminobenzoyl-glutamate transport protein